MPPSITLRSTILLFAHTISAKGGGGAGHGIGHFGGGRVGGGRFGSLKSRALKAGAPKVGGQGRGGRMGVWFAGVGGIVCVTSPFGMVSVYVRTPMRLPSRMLAVMSLDHFIDTGFSFDPSSTTTRLSSVAVSLVSFFEKVLAVCSTHGTAQGSSS
ncbi:hypothetical protein K458DRAFT_405087 [Lentithecium fluviatile CBS 122367]|uniref:Secreted protein n=1 Tax=Lentithecium fluviatile CBS 122367 TaxID=1168545 RepID=A0A6G1IXE9_9PLEO|nr:hypothetical protein K458DRAFT_405087 [Lentithecium fluviatile CBS 122367]